jgi:hypothetical protein
LDSLNEQKTKTTKKNENFNIKIYEAKQKMEKKQVGYKSKIEKK